MWVVKIFIFTSLESELFTGDTSEWQLFTSDWNECFCSVKSNTSSGPLRGWHLGLEVLVCLVVRHSSPGLSVGKTTSFFCLSFSWWSGMFDYGPSLFSFLEELTFCPSWWKPALYLSCTACRGEHPSVCPAGFASLSPGACHSHLMWSGVCCRLVLSPYTYIGTYLCDDSGTS